MTAPDLKPCPFCGSAADEGPIHVIHSERDEGHPEHWTVQCDECTATLGYLGSEEEAIAAWNRRADLHDAAMAKAREALAPFAEWANDLYPDLPDDYIMFATAGDLRRAHAALAALDAAP